MVRTTKLTPPIFGLRREIDKLFEDSFGNAGGPMLAAGAWMPVVDVKETGDALIFTAEVPGMTEEKLEITAEDGVLVLGGVKESARKDADGKWHIVERTFGSFRRSFQLPTNVQTDKIEATLKHGVLEVVVPKAEQAKPKKVEVKVK